MATYESKKYGSIQIAATQIADGSVTDSEFQTVDTSSSISTQLGTKVPLAGGTMTGTLAYDDNVKATFGTGADLEIFHDSNNSFIKNGTGTLKFLEDTTEFKNNADDTTFLSINSTGVTGDFISGQASVSSASGSDEILAKIGGAIKRITITNAALAGPAGPTGPAGPDGPPGPTGSVTNDATSVGALRMLVPVDNSSNNATESVTNHVPGTSYDASSSGPLGGLSSFVVSGANSTADVIPVPGGPFTAIGGTWLCLGASGDVTQVTGGGSSATTRRAKYAGLFLRTA